MGALWEGAVEDEFMLFGLGVGHQHAAGDIAHEEAGQEKGGRNANRADVFFDIGL